MSFLVGKLRVASGEWRVATSSLPFLFLVVPPRGMKTDMKLALSAVATRHSPLAILVPIDASGMTPFLQANW